MKSKPILTVREYVDRLRLTKNLDIRAFLVFQRLCRFYKTLNVVAALVAGLSLAILTFNEFHPTESSLVRAAEGFLCSSAITAVISAMTSTMLLFRFEGQEHATRKDLALAWSPLFMLDLAIVEYLLGLLLWYNGKNNRWRIALMSLQMVGLLLFSISLAVWMWQSMTTLHYPTVGASISLDKKRTCTHKDNLEQRQKGFQAQDLPKTFQDTVEVTRQLGKQYLWIDSLCIIQGLEEGEETDNWKKESKRMETVFSLAYCTLAASSAKGSDEGFLKLRPSSLPLQIQTKDGRWFYVSTEVDNFLEDVEKAPLNG
ncbi:hypothetical protein BLS_007406 [Venturia inaequalis]|uniref:Heterokaryon incompatibility domain-containing protein n=1 Tax=Venturia inaequalis TaxID=5025 RepID=A0A8H3V2V7_VENIN|nr:hypothetical protein BLS_007406 [Venturia inaequalis]